MIYLNLLFIRLSLSHDPRIMLKPELTLLIFYFVFLTKIFKILLFNIKSQREDWELTFIICFDFISMELSLSHDQILF